MTSGSKSSSGPHATIAISSLATFMGRPVASVHKSLQHATLSRLIRHDVTRILGHHAVSYSVRREALREFILHGVRYAFAARPGARVRGTATAWSTAPLSGELNPTSGQNVVWPDAEGDMRGESIAPLHDSALVVSKRSPVMYQALALIDAIRVGQVRERKLASELFSKLLDEHMG
jgi:hypothetical protein